MSELDVKLIDAPQRILDRDYTPSIAETKFRSEIRAQIRELRSAAKANQA